MNKEKPNPNKQKPIVRYYDVGLIDYKQCWDLQEKIFNQIIEEKVRARHAGEQSKAINQLLFCQHPHVYTLGKSGEMQNLLLDEHGLEKVQASFYKINRGGDITYHGPGQLVGYPIWDLDHFFPDIHKYLRFLEEAIIQTLGVYGIEAGRFPGYTGVWLDPDLPAKARKICAMGVRCSRWVTMHGFAFNVNTNLSYFDNIIPCGIKDKDVTSMQKELGRTIDMEEVKLVLKNKLSYIFDYTYE